MSKKLQTTKQRETMKTNQLMNVQLGAKGLGKRDLDSYLKKVDTWEYMVKVWNSEIVGVKDVVQNKAILELKTPASTEAPLNIVVSEALGLSPMVYNSVYDLPTPKNNDSP